MSEGRAACPRIERARRSWARLVGQTTLAGVLLCVCTQDTTPSPKPTSPAATACISQRLGTIAHSGIEFSVSLGENLAGPSTILSTDGTKGQIWFYHASPAPGRAQLEAKLLGGSEARSFEIFQVGVVTWPDGSSAYAYALYDREPVLRVPGCWLVRVVGSADDDEVAVTVR